LSKTHLLLRRIQHLLRRLQGLFLRAGAGMAKQLVRLLRLLRQAWIRWCSRC
jgi:hypothetical protein